MNSKTTHCGVGLLAADMQVMATFYRDVLGLETDWDGGSFEIGHWLPAFADVDAEYEKLKAKGVAVPADGHHHLALRYPQFLHCRPGGQSAGDRQRHAELSRRFGKFGINFL